MIENLFSRLRHVLLLSISARQRPMAARVVCIVRLTPSRLFAGHYPRKPRGFSSINSLRSLKKRWLLLLLPGRIEQIPDRIVDREVHVAGEDGEPVVAVIRAGVV